MAKDNIKDRSLSQCMAFAGISAFPQQLRSDDGDSFWTDAIVLVKKRDMSMSYAVATRGLDGMIKYVADFGNASQTAALLSVHPYKFIDKKECAMFFSKEDKRDFLVKYIGGDAMATEAINNMTDEDIDNAVAEISIQLHKKRIMAEKDYSKIVDSVKDDIDMGLESIRYEENIDIPSYKNMDEKSTKKTRRKKA